MLLVEEEVEIPIQINGKVKSKIKLIKRQMNIAKKALADKKIDPYLA